MAAETSPSGYPKPRYGKEVVGKRLKVFSSKDNTWRTGQVTAYHGGYYRHTIKYDDGETEQNHTYALDYQFLPEPDAEPIPDLLNTTVSVLWDNSKWHRGTVVGFDGLSHTVVYDDGDTQHVTLQKHRYKVLDGPKPLPPKPRPRSANKAVEQGGQQASQAAPAPAKQLRTNISNPLAASRSGASKPASKAGSALSGGAAGGGGDGGGGHGPSHAAVADSTRGDANRPLTREERERRGSSVEKDRTKFYLEATGRNEKRMPQLNMSHVSKKDREAARMLLGFSTPTAGEGIFASTGYGDAKGSSVPIAPGRAAIAAAAAAAAVAAGLTDPGDLYGSGDAATAIGREPMGMGDGGADAAAAGGGSSGAGSPTGPGAPVGGGSGVSQLIHELLSGMQWQMQQLVNQEDQRWLEVTTLQTKVSRLQRERDEALSSRDHVMVERDVALQQVRQLQDDKVQLASQVHTLQDEAARLLGQLNVERGMSSNAALDAAALRTQVHSLRSELTQCRTEVSQLLSTIRQPMSGGFAGALGGLGSLSGLSGYGGMSTIGGMQGGMGASMATSMMGYGSHSSLGAIDNAAAAAAAAPTAPAAAVGHQAVQATAGTTVAGVMATKKGGMQRLGPSASGGTSLRLGGGEGGNRSSGRGNLVQMGPGTLVVGPRSKQQQQGHSWPDNHAAQAAAVLAASDSAAAVSASLDAIAAAVPVPVGLTVMHQDQEAIRPAATPPRQPEHQEQQQQHGEHEQTVEGMRAAKPVVGNGAALKDGDIVDGAEAGAVIARAAPAGAENSTKKPTPQPDEALLPTSEAGLGAKNNGGSTPLQPPNTTEQGGTQADAANLSAATGEGRNIRRPLASGSNLIMVPRQQQVSPKSMPLTNRKRTRASAAQEQQEHEQQQQEPLSEQQHQHQQQQLVHPPAGKKLAADAAAVQTASANSDGSASADADGNAEAARSALSEEAPSDAVTGVEEDLEADEVMASAEHSPLPAPEEVEGVAG